jgi:hypothetical protein
MELVFNELSFLECDNEHVLTNKFIQLAELFEKAQKIHGYTHFLFPSNLSLLAACSNMTFGVWLNSIPTKSKNKILPIIFKRPFTEEYLGDKLERLSSYFFVSKDLALEQEYCDGLATADIMEIPAMSLSNHTIWLEDEITIYKETQTVPETLTIKNLATEEVLNSESFNAFSEKISSVHLKESNLTIEEKLRNISLRDDHGKDKLQKLAEKIVHNKYVDGVVNSIPFNPRTSRFIKSVYKRGLIEIVMHWEDAGYGMIIQTTGKNFKETDVIAKILRDEFDR